jgi:predicted transcriptional regulator
MARKAAKLTDTDWVLLKALWDVPPQPMGSIVQSVRNANPDIRWSYKTYYTYLNNLCDKGFAAYDIRNAKADRLYYALIARDEAMEMESESLLSRVSSDYLPRLFATMARSGQLSPQEQRKLMEFVAELEREEAERGE